MFTATTGTGTLTLGAALPGCTTFAGMPVPLNDGDVGTFELVDIGTSTVGKEKFVGTYRSAGPTLSRDTVIWSTNGGAKLNLSGNAFVFVTADDGDVVLSSQIPASLTPHAVLLGEGTAAVGAATVGILGRVLTDQGPGVDPVFAMPGPPGARTLLSAPANFFYKPSTGSDANAGTALSPWASPAPLFSRFDFGNQTVTLNLMENTAVGAIIRPWSGGGALILDAAGHSITPTNADAIALPAGSFLGPFTYQNVALGTSGSGFNLNHTAACTVNQGVGVTHNAAASGHLLAQFGTGAHVILANSYAIAGGAPTHLHVGAALFDGTSPITMTFSGNPQFPTGFAVANVGVIDLTGVTFSGTRTGYPSGSAGLNGVIVRSRGGTAASNDLPGDGVVTLSNGGQFL